VSGNADAAEALAVADALVAPLAAVSSPVPSSMRMRSRTVALPAALHVPAASPAGGGSGFLRSLLSTTSHAAASAVSGLKAAARRLSNQSEVLVSPDAAASDAALAAADITVSFEWIHRQPARNPADANAALLAILLVGPQVGGRKN
jgi:hypothetical protein